MNSYPKASSAPSSYPYQRRTGTDDTAGRVSLKKKLAGSRILVVEDEFIIALELQSSLEEAGAAVLGPAYTVSDAVEFAQRESFTAAVLDLRLEQSSAAPVAAILAERHIPFLFYTGQPATDPVRQAWPEAVALSKPASGDEIVQAVAAIIRTTH